MLVYFPRCMSSTTQTSANENGVRREPPVRAYFENVGRAVKRAYSHLGEYACCHRCGRGKGVLSSWFLAGNMKILDLPLYARKEGVWRRTVNTRKGKQHHPRLGRGIESVTCQSSTLGYRTERKLRGWLCVITWRAYNDVETSGKVDHGVTLSFV